MIECELTEIKSEEYASEFKRLVTQAPRLSTSYFEKFLGIEKMDRRGTSIPSQVRPTKPDMIGHVIEKYPDIEEYEYDIALNIDKFKEVRRGKFEELISNLIVVEHLCKSKSIGVGKKGKELKIYQSEFGAHEDMYDIKDIEGAFWIEVPSDFLKKTYELLPENSKPFFSALRY